MTVLEAATSAERSYTTAFWPEHGAVAAVAGGFMIQARCAPRETDSAYVATMAVPAMCGLTSRHFTMSPNCFETLSIVRSADAGV